MATLLDNSPKGRKIMDDALQSARTPHLVRAPFGSNHTTAKDHAYTLRVDEYNDKKSVSGRTGRRNDMVFAYSGMPFDLEYLSDNGNVEIMRGISAAVIPYNLSYSIRNAVSLHLNFAQSDFGAVPGRKITLPVGYTMDYIKRHLREGRMVVKMAVPVHMYGEDIALGGETMDVHKEKCIVVGPQNRELSAAGSRSPQDVHLHRELVETYTTYGGMVLHYITNGRMDSIEAKPGEILVVPQNIIHKAEIYDTEPTFVTMSAPRGVSIKDDKFVVSEETSAVSANKAIKAILRK